VVGVNFSPLVVVSDATSVVSAFVVVDGAVASGADSVVRSVAFLVASELVIDVSDEWIVVAVVGVKFSPLLVVSDATSVVSAFVVVDGAVASDAHSVARSVAFFTA
jgi:hypothetical protein